MRMDSQQELIKPVALINSLPATASALDTITSARQYANHIIQDKDDRLLVIIGPCSIHDTEAALDYAVRLKQAAEHFIDDLYPVMRVYFEKPRTTIGWKGLVSDPFLDGRFDVNHGLSLARQLLVDLNHLGVPAGTEFLDTLILPQYLSDLVSWCAVGARTVESQIHRELASGLSMPVGFKNNTDGNIKVAIDAVKVASYSHHFLSITKDGIPSIIRTQGNQNCHIILRGANNAPNYTESHINEAATILKNANLLPKIMIDCSHGNSMKEFQRQVNVVHDVAQQLNNGSPFICGVMLESNLISGKQDLNLKHNLVYGQSITDACIGWDDSVMLLETLALATRQRRLKSSLINTHRSEHGNS